jgi:hypothetical protein
MVVVVEVEIHYYQMELIILKVEIIILHKLVEDKLLVLCHLIE